MKILKSFIFGVFMAVKISAAELPYEVPDYAEMFTTFFTANSQGIDNALVRYFPEDFTKSVWTIVFYDSENSELGQLVKQDNGKWQRTKISNIPEVAGKMTRCTVCTKDWRLFSLVDLK